MFLNNKNAVKHFFDTAFSSILRGVYEKQLGRIICTAVVFSVALILDHFTNFFCGRDLLRCCVYILALSFVGLSILREAIVSACSGDVFTEFTLMSLAAIGAFVIGEYPEGVAVMLLYAVGEFFQDKAVDAVRGNIKSLVNIRPLRARVKIPCSQAGKGEGDTKIVDPMEVTVGECIVVKKGERVCVDGEVVSKGGLFDTSSLTGESEPRYISEGEEVLSGMILLENSVEIRTLRIASESELERILRMVEDAGERKSHTELFIRRFARVYTPVIMGLALLIVVLPLMFSAEYNFRFWLYKALMLLVVSCPCALVISVPLSYYSAIGIASKRGILFKGGSYIDALCRVKYMFFDKTGTLTKPGAVTIDEVPANDGSSDVPEFSEELKDDAATTISALKSLGIEEVIILSGDRMEKVEKIANAVGADRYFAELLPEGKLVHLNQTLREGKLCAFVGDGVNDAPVLRSANVGIAMGALGSEAAVESADVVLKTDQLSKLPEAVRIARKTEKIVKENIMGVLAVKVLILLLGFIGVTSLWGAVFADSGVALLAVANSLRLRGRDL